REIAESHRRIWTSCSGGTTVDTLTRRPLNSLIQEVRRSRPFPCRNQPRSTSGLVKGQFWNANGGHMRPPGFKSSVCTEESKVFRPHFPTQDGTLLQRPAGLTATSAEGVEPATYGFGETANPPRNIKNSDSTREIASGW